LYIVSTHGHFIYLLYPQIISSCSAAGIGCMQLSVADRCLLQMMRCETTCFNCLALVFFLGGKRNIRYISYITQPWSLHCLELDAAPL